MLLRVTYKCNRNCEFCFNNIFDDKVDYDISDKIDITKLIDFIRKHNFRKVHISGGEPTMYKNIDKIVREISKVTRVSYFTNGMLFKRFSPDEIHDLGIAKIKVTLYNDELINGDKSFFETLKSIAKIKEKYPEIKFKAALMIDDDFFKVIASPNYEYVIKLFDNIKWQPLTVPVEHRLYPHTIEGMNIGLRNEILAKLSTFYDNKANYYDEVLESKMPEKCYMGKEYITMNPDMSISLCPHLNDKNLSIEEYEELLDIKDNFFESPKCLSMRCVSLYSFLNKKYGGKK